VPLPSADQALATTEPPPVTLDKLDPGQQDRVNEAAVRAAEARTHRAADDRDAPRTIVSRVVWGVIVQVVIADVVFVRYAHEKGWDVPVGPRDSARLRPCDRQRVLRHLTPVFMRGCRPVSRATENQLF